jgi:hypothetical protein
MRSATNLSWPEGPFGGSQRPYGKPVRLIAAFALEWNQAAGTDDALVGVAVSYLSAPRTGVRFIEAGQSSFGFHVAATDQPAELPQLLAILDRALVRARRQAVVLAGDRLGDDLAKLIGSASQGWPGVRGVLEAWQARERKGRGLARMFDIAHDRTDLDAALLVPDMAAVPSRDDTMFSLLLRSLSIGLISASRLDLVSWHGTFRLDEAVRTAAWDVLDTPRASPREGRS